MILTDAIHTITGAVNVHNLEIQTLTGARNITLTNVVTTTGTTTLNGVLGNLIAFVDGGAGNITAFTSYYCSGNGGIANITCNAGAPPVAAATNIPTLSEWMLILLAMMLGFFAVLKMKGHREM